MLFCCFALEFGVLFVGNLADVVDLCASIAVRACGITLIVIYLFAGFVVEILLGFLIWVFTCDCDLLLLFVLGLLDVITLMQLSFDRLLWGL